jgi:23S rRNA pseudouridine2605 synthase
MQENNDNQGGKRTPLSQRKSPRKQAPVKRTPGRGKAAGRQRPAAKDDPSASRSSGRKESGGEDRPRGKDTPYSSGARGRGAAPARRPTGKEDPRASRSPGRKETGGEDRPRGKDTPYSSGARGRGAAPARRPAGKEDPRASRSPGRKETGGEDRPRGKDMPYSSGFKGRGAAPARRPAGKEDPSASRSPGRKESGGEDRPRGKDTPYSSGFKGRGAAPARRPAGKSAARGGGTGGKRPEKEHPFEKFRQEKPVSERRISEDARGGKFNKDKAATGRPEKKYGEPKEIRLNRYLANSGVCSRREADNYIAAGHVTVNDKIVKELGTKVTYSDDVRFKGKKLNPEKKIYLLLNKPKDYITTVDDPYAKRTVMELVRNSCRERIYPVGRLDRHTTGLLLFTNDGELTKMLTHPSHKVAKIYQVGLDRPVERADMEKIAHGFELEDGHVKVDEISYIDQSDKSQVGIQLHSGRNRIVRRIFQHVGYKVIRLDRVFFAGLTKKNVPRGKWRFLNEKEVNMLKMNIFK